MLGLSVSVVPALSPSLSLSSGLSLPPGSSLSPGLVVAGVLVVLAVVVWPARELGVRTRPDRLGLLPALGHCLLAARAAGRVIVDGVYNAFQDEAGLAAECAQGRDLGFDGKTLIHPSQIEIANAAFAPDPSDLDLARRQIAAFEAAESEGRGVAVLDGRIVENLHVDTARRLLAQAEAIGAMAQD